MSNPKMNLTDVISLINARLQDNPLFFVSNDIERGLGLENLLENFHLIATFNSPLAKKLKDQNKSVYICSLDSGKPQTSAALLGNPNVIEFISKRSNASKSTYVQTFKISPRFERFAKDNNFSIINTTSKLNKEFEDKISQFEILKNSDVKMPTSFVSLLGEVKYEQAKAKLGDKFVIQFNRSHTGLGTNIIFEKQTYTRLQEKFPKREVKYSKFLEGPSFTLNCCATKHGTYVAGLSYQITGLLPFTDKKSATIGNDWSITKEIDKSDILDQAEIVGDIMYQNGFRGMFGIDCILSLEDQFLYTIEINARQPASVPLFTKHQIERGLVPLSAIHLLEFLNIPFEIDREKYNDENTKSIDASQIFYRMPVSSPKVRNELLMGTYSFDSRLNFVRDNIDPYKIKSGEFIIIPVKIDRQIKVGHEILRIITNETVMKNYTSFNEKYAGLGKALKSELFKRYS